MVKSIRTSSKTSKAKWNKTVRSWKLANPADFDDYRYCKVGHGALSDGMAFGGWQLNLCHDISRARDKTQEHNIDNIFAGCPKHNREQGSTSLDEYLSTNPDKHCGI